MRPGLFSRLALSAVASVSLASFAGRVEASDGEGDGNGSEVSDPNRVHHHRVGVKCRACDRCDCEDDKRTPAFDEKTGIGGLRLSGTRVSGADEDGTAGSLTFAGNGEDYTTKDQATTHAAAFWAIGGGSANFEGALGGKFTGGWRIPVDLHQGPVIRLGFAGYLQGNSLLYASMFELPLLQVGYQYQLGYTLLEAGFEIAPVLAGRYDPAGSQRRLGGNFLGSSYVAAHFAHFRLDASLERNFGGNSGDHTPIDAARVTACTYARPFGVCADFWGYRGDVLAGAAWQSARSAFFGLLVGYSSR